MSAFDANTLYLSAICSRERNSFSDWKGWGCQRITQHFSMLRGAGEVAPTDRHYYGIVWTYTSELLEWC